MRLGGRIPVEPLDDERLTHIERQIVLGAADRLAHPARAPRRLLAIAGGALALAAAVLVGSRLHRAEPARATPAEPAPATALALHASARGATVELDGATVTSDPDTDLELTRAPGRVVIEMRRGRVELAVVHREGRTILVRAGDTEIEDVGTRFAVAYDGARAVDVRVTEGKVAVTHQARRVEVAAGYAWTTDRGLVAIADLTGPVAAASGSGSGAGTAAVAIASPPPRVLHGRHAAVPDVAPAASHVVAMRPARPSHEPALVKAAPPRHAPSDPYVDLKVAIRRQPIAFDPKLDGVGDAAAEIARLKPVAYAPQKYGDEASRALYEIAVLLDKPLHQDAEALHTIDFYVRRFPAGKELAAALWLRVRIACSKNIDDDCRRAAYSFQHVVTSGPAADVAMRITNAQ